MARYELRFKKSVTKDLRNIPGQDVRRILNRLESLASNPRGVGCKQLSGRDVYRVRQGSYRIIYEIIDRRLLVHVIRIAHRSTAYR